MSTRRIAAVFQMSLLAAGCSRDFCEEFFDGECPNNGGNGATGGDGTGGEGGGGTGGDGGGGGSPPAECEPSEGEPIGAACGVFVKAGGTGTGTQASPFGSVTQAVAELGNASRIYICGGESFSGSIAIDGDVSITGGLDCATWGYKDTNAKPEIEGVDVPAVSITGAGSGMLLSLRITSPDAVAAGASSVAVWIETASTTVRSCELSAGKGAVGIAGAPQAKVATPATANGKSGELGCDGTTTTNLGGDPGDNMCLLENVQGGLGGNGTNGTNGGGADDGVPLSASGQGGAGEIGGGSPMACGNGGQGSQGAAGTPGPGALTSDIGSLSRGGFNGAAGGNGLTVGAFGQGGIGARFYF